MISLSPEKGDLIRGVRAAWFTLPGGFAYKCRKLDIPPSIIGRFMAEPDDFPKVLQRLSEVSGVPLEAIRSGDLAAVATVRAETGKAGVFVLVHRFHADGGVPVRALITDLEDGRPESEDSDARSSSPTMSRVYSIRVQTDEPVIGVTWKRQYFEITEPMGFTPFGNEYLMVTGEG